ncbi:hypothetical protein, partial [Vibrio splendidus]|uniref:hypothetical protein n=1 Tax=Vibrio splendidus TaxID=29497 RepID=UPI003D148402
ISGLPQAEMTNSSLVEMSLSFLMRVSSIQLSGAVIENDFLLLRINSAPDSLRCNKQFPIEAFKFSSFGRSITLPSNMTSSVKFEVSSPRLLMMISSYQQGDECRL